MQLALGLSLQLIGCSFAAMGLALMKLSSERDGALFMLLRWRWWLGFLFLAVLATIVEGTVLTLVPLAIVAPFAGVTILFNMFIASTGCISAKVPLSKSNLMGGIVTVAGVGLVSLFGPNGEQAERSLSFSAVLRALVDPHFMLFISVTLFSVCAWLCVVFAPTHALRRLRAVADEANLTTPLSAYAAAVCGALSQTFLKSVSVAISYSFSLPVSDGMSWGATALQEVWLQPPMPIALVGVATCAPLQLFLIDVCLASGAVTYAVPLYQALLVSLEIIAAAIFFRELEHEPIARLFGFALGVAVATAGLVVLSSSEANARRPSKSSQSVGPKQDDVEQSRVHRAVLL